MGQAIAAARQQASQADEESKKKTLEQLSFLVNAANSKLDHYQNQLEEQFFSMFQDPESVSKKQIPGMRAVRWERGYRVGIKNNDEDTASGLNDVVDGTFGAIGSAVNGGSVLSGFKKIVGGALKAILGCDEAGEQEEQKFFVFVKHNAIIRIDVKIWRYNFSNKGIIAGTENVFCYTFCTSVVNSAALKYDEITYLLSEYAGDLNVEAYAQKLLQVWKTIADMHAFLQRRDHSLGSLPVARPKTEARASTPPPPYSPKRKQVQLPEKMFDDEPKEQVRTLQRRDGPSSLPESKAKGKGRVFTPPPPYSPRRKQVQPNRAAQYQERVY
ncbi:hypothetical protein MD484_g6827, partial [Candolleomyces efflorescens]